MALYTRLVQTVTGAVGIMYDGDAPEMEQFYDAYLRHHDTRLGELLSRRDYRHCHQNRAAVSQILLGRNFRQSVSLLGAKAVGLHPAARNLEIYPTRTPWRSTQPPKRTPEKLITRRSRQLSQRI